MADLDEIAKILEEIRDDTVPGLTGAIRDLTAATGEAGSASRDAADASREAADATSEYADRAKDAEKATKDLTLGLDLMGKGMKKTSSGIGKIFKGFGENKLEEVNLSNARLYYTNCVLGNSSLNERQKQSFAETISDIQTVNEAKVVYETLLKTVAAKTTKSGPKSLSEAVAKTSSTIIGSHKREQAFEKDPTKSRWAKLAGLRG